MTPILVTTSRLLKLDKFKRDFKERMDSHADVFTELRNAPNAVRNTGLLERACAAMHERERETFFLFRLCEQATYIIRAQDTVTALLQVQTIEGVGQLGGLKEL